MDESGLSPDEVIAMVRRRIGRLLLVAVALLPLAAAVALLWPPMYRSTATILVEEQEIPRDLVRSTVTSFADERIQIISQQIMTRGTLVPIIEKYDLYPRERRHLSNEEILERMRQDIKLSTVNADLGGRAAQRGSSTIAFKLSYDNETPAKAQKVANELVTLYLNENLRTRRQKADETSAFLADEAQRLGKQIAETSEKIAQFKKTNAGRLPELMQLNMQLRDRAETQLVDLDRQIKLLEDRRVYLETQLTVVKQSAPIPPGERALDPADRLKLLRRQYAGLSGVYAPDHPDLVRIRREMEALERSTGAKPDADFKALEDARNELARLGDQYSADHPDVVRQKKLVAALEADYLKSSEKGEASAKPDNPAYVQLAAQIESVKSEAESLRAQRDQLHARLAGYDARLEQTPIIERGYNDLVRDQDNAVTKYREIRAKQMEAETAGELERERKAERFSLIDPPQYPEKPFKPNRAALLAVALAVSLGGGIGAAGVTEALDRSVKGTRALAALLEAPVLGVLPRIEDQERRRRRRRWLLRGLAAGAALLLAAVAVVHWFFMPLESLWYVLLGRLAF
jgi:uncharacterized protein involved in exopolysaccharide biosynthesis